MLRKLVQYFFLSLVLLLVFLASALLAMRFAIHGREVRVPKLAGLTPAAAERAANAEGLVLSVERRFYSASVPQGRIVSQVPAPDTTVRRGWKILVAESLGPQRAAVPNLIGQSQHAAGINLGRRGLEIGTVATLHLPGVPPQTVIAQNPPANAKDLGSPKVDLLLSAADNQQRYVMPSFVGKPLAEAMSAVERAGLEGKVRGAAVSAKANGRASKNLTGVVTKQSPVAGKKVAAGTSVEFEVQK